MAKRRGRYGRPLKNRVFLAFTLILFLTAGFFFTGAAYASQEASLIKGPAGLNLSAIYEGRFNIVDPGDSTGRHAIFNIVWLDVNKIDTGGVNIFARAKALGFEGDSYVKQHSGINELEALTVNEAYINRSSKNYDFNFGMFHDRVNAARPEPLFDIKDVTYGFDLMNPIRDKKAKGNFYYRKNLKEKYGAFVNYQFNVDYASSLKSYGADYAGFSIRRAFNDMRDYLIIDYAGAESREVSFRAGYRNNKFNFLSPFVQFRSGAAVKIGRSIAGCKITRLTAELLSNSTSDGYYLLKRNAADLISGNVIFFYQKYVGALKIESLLNDRFNTSLSLESYFAIKPQFGREDGLTEDIGKLRTYKMAARSHYGKATVETAILSTSNDDGSYLLTEKLNLRLRVLYPF
ncbi:MAG: hypothetical protein A2008_07675 [Candidatus Wallbacteria bacterium GWC2_49_35]|uniref:Uncharacterized protein n=1 Tax=Candidatus Wallbacteria bacterium GWC2_49_35 TaxID=1817813 RepID=A0A1F7WET7_9BACT|nr:MAG: hypothetical protein A2008_07675 [Candidatus Wallbacteria bacterium GWC2_49_35]